ncbi:hypothetical protein [Actinomadura rupiterrae]|uniref:hypothetical protein n=1 Tax=Actinomadura rupiterrae TaxID=559627 RepID=UPI0020A4F96B|nr:hypothetical protein [Actinomadura rupiterrae]MCP2337887.1 hypothetical protein [Actinomadura rupiterrae]
MSLTTAVRTPDAQRAAVRYSEADLAADALIGQLHGRLPAATRAELLYDLAVQRAVQAETIEAAYGPQTTSDAQPRALAAALHDEAVLISALAATETAAATGRRRALVAAPFVEVWIGEVLDQLAATTDPAERYDLIAELYEPLEPLIGDQTARQICALGDRYAPDINPEPAP